MTIHEQIKANSNVIYKDEDILVVLDHDPITKGHVLILPQNQYLDIDDVPLPVLLRIFKAAQIYIQLLKSKYLPKGYSIMQNGGTFNEIDVFHLHVFPRFKNDEFGFMQNEIVETVDVAELRQLFQFEWKEEDLI